MFRNKKFIVHKQATSSSKYDETDATSDLDDYSYSYDEDTNFTQDGGGQGYVSIVNSNFQKPRGGSRQDKMGTEEVKKRLQGFMPLKTIQEQRLL